MKSARHILLSMGAVFLAFGLVFMGVSFGIRQNMLALMDAGVSAQGEFISVGKGNTRVRYEAEGKEWVLESSTYSSDMDVGDEITVWYLPGEPGSGRMEHWAMWGVFLIVGGTFAVIGIGFLAAMLPKIMKRRSLMANGTPVTAQVTGVIQNRSVRINRVHPYVIHAVCIHHYTGQTMKVKSELLMEDPRPRMKEDTVQVLVDPMRDGRYYMPVDEIGK